MAKVTSVSYSCRELLLSSMSDPTSCPIETCTSELYSTPPPLQMMLQKSSPSFYIFTGASCLTGYWPPALSFLHDGLFLNSLWYLTAWCFRGSFQSNTWFIMETIPQLANAFSPPGTVQSTLQVFSWRPSSATNQTLSLYYIIFHINVMCNYMVYTIIINNVI